MPTPFRYHVSLQVRHPTMDAERIGAALGLAQSHGWSVGDLRATPDGTVLGGIRPESYCSFVLGAGENGALARCLDTAVEMLTPRGDALREIAKTGGSTNFFVFWYPNGDTGEVFTAILLRRIADLGIDLGINVFDDRAREQDA